MALEIHNFDQLGANFGERFQKLAIDFFVKKIAKERGLEGKRLEDQAEEDARQGLYYVFQDWLSLVNLETIQENKTIKQKLIDLFEDGSEAQLALCIFKNGKTKIELHARSMAMAHLIRNEYDDNLHCAHGTSKQILNWMSA